MTQDKRRDALIKELDIRRGDAVAQADYCLAREKELLKRIRNSVGSILSHCYMNTEAHEAYQSFLAIMKEQEVIPCQKKD